MSGYRPETFIAPELTLDQNLALSALRYPASPAIHFFGSMISYEHLEAMVSSLSGWLQKRANVKSGDRVAVFMQNSPQWLISFYAVIRAGGIVVPISPMNREAEVRHYIADSGASLLIVAEELLSVARSVLDILPPPAVLAVRYADFVAPDRIAEAPKWIVDAVDDTHEFSRWTDALLEDCPLHPAGRHPDDICALPYTSGSTGKPKACIHTHRTLMHTAAGMAYWHGIVPGDVSLGAAPMYHVSGLCHAVTSPIFAGAAVVILPRWDRTAVLDAIERHRVTHASLPPTAVIDLLGAPDIEIRDLSSVRRISSGGSAMPEAVWSRLRDVLKITFLEAYGMTETAATTHLNPPEAPRAKCLGVPFFGTRALIVDPDTMAEMPTGDVGEILISGPQLFKGYWHRPDESARALVTIGGRTYLRSGDIGYADADGYYYMTDRAKRMINASGLKVWPSEIENVLHGHPAIREACVVASPDPYRGETVKALIVLGPDIAQPPTEDELIGWCKERMAAYKYPRIIAFVESLPKSPAGKILWRDLQNIEMSKAH